MQNSARILNTQPVPNKAEVPEVLSPISSRSMSRPQLYGGLHAAPGANALSSGGRKSSDRRSHRSARSQAPGARSMPSLTVVSPRTRNFVISSRESPLCDRFSGSPAAPAASRIEFSQTNHCRRDGCLQQRHGKLLIVTIPLMRSMLPYVTAYRKS